MQKGQSLNGSFAKCGSAWKLLVVLKNKFQSLDMEEKQTWYDMLPFYVLVGLLLFIIVAYLVEWIRDHFKRNSNRKGQD